MKKILFVVDSLGCGGAEKSLCNLLSVFDYSKYEVYLQLVTIPTNICELIPKEVKVLSELNYLVFCKKPLIKQIFNRGFLTRAKVFFGLKKEKNLHNSQTYWKYAQKGFETLHVNYDVAIAWGQGFPVYFVMDKVKATKKFAFINADCFAQGYNKKFDFCYFSKYERVVGISQFLEEKLRREYPSISNKIITIYDIVKIDDIIEKAREENPYKNDDELKIVTVGRLVKEKGYDLAIDACEELVHEGVKFRWYIVGEGQERVSIENNVRRKGLEKNLMLLGAKENPYPYVRYADIYVQCSRHEGFCLTLKEAKILNKPIVCTNFETAYLQIENEKNGLLVDMDGKEIAAGIIRLANDNSLKKELEKNLKEESKDNRSEIEKLYKLIEE